MKNLIYLLLPLLLLTTCKKAEKLGSVEVKITYHYSNYTGNVPDEGASIFLFKDEGKSIKFSTVIRKGIVNYDGDPNPAQLLFEAKADAAGVAKIYGIPYGKYLIVAGSKGRILYAVKSIEVNSETQTLVKDFGFMDHDPLGESW
jgi:hypothetical protein